MAFHIDCVNKAFGYSIEEDRWNEMLKTMTQEEIYHIIKKENTYASNSNNKS